jgi:hypothetical protein
MLRPAELLSADPGLVDQTFIPAFIQEDALALERPIQMAKALVTKGTVDEPDIVPEIARRASD